MRQSVSSIMNQKNAFQALTSLAPHWLKSNAVAGKILKHGSAALTQLGTRHLLYDNEVSIVSGLLARLNKPASLKDIHQLQDECRHLFPSQKFLYYSSRELVLYPLVRLLKPRHIVETGCAWGGSAAYLLAALQKNGSGHLVSIDLPAGDTVQHKAMGISEAQIGQLIPQDLRGAWTLIVGDARVHLPKILAETDAEIFIHDSLHTATHQAFEYETARSLMREKSILASDDIRWNDSFFSFIRLHGLRAYAPLGNKNFGITLNDFDSEEKKCGLFREG
jgi:hypothetical protein